MRLLRSISCGLLLAVLLLPSAYTIYFVDVTKKNGTGLGTDTTNAFTNLDSTLQNQGAGIGPALAAGDTVFVRGTDAETLTSDIVVVSDGTQDAAIVVWGDADRTVTGLSADRWWPNDDPGSRATITCGAYQLAFDLDECWLVRRITWDANTEYAIGATRSARIEICDCVITDLAASADYGIYAYAGGQVYLRDCAFDGGGQGVGIYAAYGALVECRGCTFDDLTHGIESLHAPVDVINCEFGQTSNNVAADIRVAQQGGAPVRVFGGLFDDNTLLVDAGSAAYYNPCAVISRYYVDAAKRPMCFVNAQECEAVANYTIHRSGGARYSIALTTPIANAPGVFAPAPVLDYAVYADSAETRTYSLYAWRDVNWDPAPAATGLRIELSYQYADTIRSEYSTATLVADSTWYALSVADVSPQHDGPVNLILWLGDYDADGKIHIDPRLVATGESYHETFDWGGPALAYLYEAPSGGARRVIIIN